MTPRPEYSLSRKIAAEVIGTALLVAIVVGSGIMGQRLSAGNDALALLGNTLATGAGLIVLILIFAPVSGAHFNPVVSLVCACRGDLSWRLLPLYLTVQFMGAIAGTLLAHLMCDLPPFQNGANMRSGTGIWVSEIIASFALVSTILIVSHRQAGAVPYAVGLVIMAGYWFTASTSFANPAVTFGRAFTETFSGIRLADVPAFMAAQVVGALLAAGFAGWLLRART